MMEAVRTSEISVHFNVTKRSYTQKTLNFTSGNVLYNNTSQIMDSVQHNYNVVNQPLLQRVEQYFRTSFSGRPLSYQWDVPYLLTQTLSPHPLSADFPCRTSQTSSTSSHRHCHLNLFQRTSPVVSVRRPVPPHTNIVTSSSFSGRPLSYQSDVQYLLTQTLSPQQTSVISFLTVYAVHIMNPCSGFAYVWSTAPCSLVEVD
jgi:hypothetical protein